MLAVVSSLIPLKHLDGWFFRLIWGLVLLSGIGGLPTTLHAQVIEPTVVPTQRAARPATPISEGAVHAARQEPSVQTPMVVVYASPVAQAYWAKTEFDGRINVQQWQVFLRKYRIPFELVTSVEQLEKTPVNTLILPSAVALSEREQNAIAHFRGKGGSVLASWLTGVRNERGQDVGFRFMEETLGVQVVGDTENDPQDNFLIAHGDSPVSHHLPAGMRIWMDRVKGLYPLRLAGGHTAVHIMDWSRKVALDKVSANVVFDERIERSGLRSRSVILGYSEQLWVSADPKLMEALSHNALLWLLRLPSVYTASWPHPYRSALVMAVDVAGPVTDRDMESAKLLEQAGGRATYYVVNETAAKSADRLKRLQSTGHEIAYMGDKYNDFREQPADVQAQRLDNMLNTLRQHGLEMTPSSGFRSPMDSYDRNTESLLRERAFGYLLGTMDSSEARLPFLPVELNGPSSPMPSSGASLSTRMLVLPRTQEGPDELVDNCDPEIGLKPFFKELQLSEQMAGLSIVPLPSRNELTDVQRAEVFDYLGSRRMQKWLSTASQVAQWWHERERVSVQLGVVNQSLHLSISIAPGPALKQAPAVWINLPEMNSVMRLSAAHNSHPAPRTVAVDAWRSAVVLDGLAPGEYHWVVRFERPSTGGSNS